MESEQNSFKGQESDKQELPDLHAGVRRFQHAATAWPEGLYFEGALATLPQVARMKSELQKLRQMDRHDTYRDFLEGFETKLNILIGQLRSDEGKCFF